MRDDDLDQLFSATCRPYDHKSGAAANYHQTKTRNDAHHARCSGDPDGMIHTMIDLDWSCFHQRLGFGSTDVAEDQSGYAGNNKNDTKNADRIHPLPPTIARKRGEET
jgi:hypothetical protein